MITFFIFIDFRTISLTLLYNFTPTPANTASPNGAPVEVSGTNIGILSIEALILSHKSLLLPPPTAFSLLTFKPNLVTSFKLWYKAKEVPSKIALIICLREVFNVNPINIPRAWESQIGDLSPII